MNTPNNPGAPLRPGFSDSIQHPGLGQIVVPDFRQVPGSNNQCVPTPKVVQVDRNLYQSRDVSTPPGQQQVSGQKGK